MNPLWLLVIVPASAAVGAVLMSLLIVAKREDAEMLEEMLEVWSKDE